MDPLMTLTQNDLQQIKALIQQGNAELFGLINDLAMHTDGQIQEIHNNISTLQSDNTNMRTDINNLESEVRTGFAYVNQSITSLQTAQARLEAR